MTLIEIQTKIEQNLPDAKVAISGDGCNCATTIIASAFEGLSLLERQKMVLNIMADEIKSGELHALTIKAYTPDEAK